MKINPDIVSYIEKEIIPRYNHFDAAHQRDHVNMVLTIIPSFPRSSNTTA